MILLLFAWSAWVQPATLLADTTGEGAALASVPSISVVSASHCVGLHDRCGRCSGVSSLGRRGHSQPRRWRAREVRALLCTLFSLSASAQPTTGVAETKREDGGLASFRLVGVGLDSHCCGGQDS
jgi:hypothetical protein